MSAICRIGIRLSIIVGCVALLAPLPARAAMNVISASIDDVSTVGQGSVLTVSMTVGGSGTVGTRTWQSVQVLSDGSPLECVDTFVAVTGGIAGLTPTRTFNVGAPAGLGAHTISVIANNNNTCTGGTSSAAFDASPMLTVVAQPTTPIAFVGSNTGTKFLTLTQEVNVDVPAGAVGDVLLALVATDGDTSAELAPTAPGDWTLLDLSATTGGSDATFGIWYRVTDGTEPAAYAFSWTNNQQAAASLLRYSGVDTNAPVDAFGVAEGQSVRPIAPDVSTTVDGAMIVRTFGSNSCSPALFIPAGTGPSNPQVPATPTLPTTHGRFDLCSGIGGAVTTAGSDALQLGGAGGTGTARFGIDAVLDKRWRAATIALAPALDLNLTKSESADPVVAGSGNGNLIYTVTLTNNGVSAASNVDVSEDLTLPAGVTVDSLLPSAGGVTGSSPNFVWSVPTLAAGASEMLTVTLTVASSAAPGADVIADAAAVTGADQSLLNPGDDSAGESTSIVSQVDLVVSKSDSIDPVVAGSGAGNLTYVVTVQNAGPSDTTNVSVSETLTLPSGVTVDSVVPSVGSVSGSAPNYTWSIPALAASANATLTVTLTAAANTVPGSDVIRDTAAVTGADQTLINTGDDSASESTSVASEVDLVVSKSDSIDPVIAGSGSGNLIYVVTLHNAGPSDASNVGVSEALTLPSGVTVDSVVPSAGSVSGSAPNYTWSIPALAASANATLTVTLTVAANTASGTDVIADTATITASDQTLINTGDDSATEATSVGGDVDLVVSKSESIDPVVAGSGSGNLTYVVTLANAGPSDASNVTVSEDLTLPAGVTVDSIVPSSGSITGSSPNYTWSIPALAESANATLTVTLTVAANAASGTDVIADTATVTASDQTLINTGDDSAGETTSITRDVDLEVTIVGSPDPVLPGSGPGNLVYVVTVTNHGPSDASGVQIDVNLTLPSGTTVESATPSAGSWAEPSWTGLDLPAQGSATLTIALTVGYFTDPGADAILASAEVVGANETLVNTVNDASADGTTVAAGIPPIPTLPPLSLLLLALLLVGAALIVMR